MVDCVYDVMNRLYNAFEQVRMFKRLHALIMGPDAEPYNNIRVSRRYDILMKRHRRLLKRLFRGNVLDEDMVDGKFRPDPNFLFNSLCTDRTSNKVRVWMGCKSMAEAEQILRRKRGGHEAKFNAYRSWKEKEYRFFREKDTRACLFDIGYVVRTQRQQTVHMFKNIGRHANNCGLQPVRTFWDEFDLDPNASTVA